MQADWKKKSLIQAIVPAYINGFSGPNSVYLLGVGWEVRDKAARLPVVKDHSCNIMTNRINVHRKFNTGKSYQTCTAWKNINSEHLREWVSQPKQQPQALNGGKEQLHQIIPPTILTPQPPNSQLHKLIPPTIPTPQPPNSQLHKLIPPTIPTPQPPNSQLHKLIRPTIPTPQPPNSQLHQLITIT